MHESPGAKTRVQLPGEANEKGRGDRSLRALFCVEMSLELKLQSQLNGAWPAGTHDGVCGSDIRGFAREAEVARARRIDCPELSTDAIGIGEVRMVQNVKEFATELEHEAFVNGEVFDERKIPVAIAGTAEQVATHGAEGAGHGRRKHAGTLREATEGLQIANPIRKSDAGRLLAETSLIASSVASERVIAKVSGKGDAAAD